jgi:hypothetical protein
MILVDQVNNKTMPLTELDIMKRKTRETTKAYWMENTGQHPSRGGCPGKGQSEIVDPGAYTEEILDRQQPDFQKASDQDPNRLPSSFDLISLKKGTVKNHSNFSSQGYILNEATTYPWVTFLYELTGVGVTLSRSAGR